MLRLIKETINQKVSEMQQPGKPIAYPSNDQKISLKDKLYQSKCDINYCKSWDSVRLVVFDTETTGFHPYGGDEIISISGIVIENGQIRHDLTFDQLVNPCRPIPADIEELTGITNEQVRNQPNIFEVTEQFLGFIGDAILVAHNADFDVAFLNVKLKRFCGFKIQNPVFDTLKVARFLFSSLESYSLDYLIENFNMPAGGRHTSLGDSVITAQLFQNLRRILRNMNINNLEELNHYMYHRASL
jgi:DNA polymerase-3 subunit epsilon